MKDRRDPKGCSKVLGAAVQLIPVFEHNSRGVPPEFAQVGSSAASCSTGTSSCAAMLTSNNPLPLEK